MQDLTVIIPCYNEDSKTVEHLYHQLTVMGASVIVVDDGWTMDLPYSMNVLKHSPNMGYGYALKRGIKACKTSILCTMDGDGQHNVSDVRMLYDAYKMIDGCKMVVGQRWGLVESGLRKWGRKCLNFIASCVSGHYFSDLNSGLRIIDTEMARGYSPILCDTFSFTTSLTIAAITDRHKMAYIPIDVKPRAFGKSHVKVFKDGWITLYYIVWVGLALRTRRIRAWIRSLIGR